MNILQPRLQRNPTSARPAPPVQRTNPGTQQGPIVLEQSLISALLDKANSQQAAPVEVSTHGLGGNRHHSVQTRTIKSFDDNNAAKVGLATALQHSHDARDRSQAPTANKLQDMFPNTFSKAKADTLAKLLKKANVHLKHAPLLDKGNQGLVLSIKGRTKKNLAAHKLNNGKAQRQKDIEEIVKILHEEGIHPKLYTGHKIGGELAHFAHKKMGALQQTDDTGAITISFDSKPQALNQASTPGLSSINIAIDKKARDLGDYIQQQGFDRLLEKAKWPAAEQTSVSRPANPGREKGKGQAKLLRTDKIKKKISCPTSNNPLPSKVSPYFNNKAKLRGSYYLSCA